MDKYDNYYMEIADLAAQQSVAQRAKVGCAILTKNKGLFTGFNGTPPGWHTNECETKVYQEAGDPGYDFPYHDEKGNYTLLTKPEVLHAERNALDKMLAEGVSSKGSTVFCTLSPCESCALALIGAQVSKVLYKDHYRCTKGVDMLLRAGIVVRQFEPKEDVGDEQRLSLDKSLATEAVKHMFRDFLKSQMSFDLFCENLNVPLRNQTARNWISGAFIWEETKQGLEYWRDLDDKWRKTLDSIYRKT